MSCFTLGCSECKEGKLNGLRHGCISCKFGDSHYHPSSSPSYEFTSFYGKKPVHIIGKRHWKQHMKENHLTDDFAFSSKTGSLKNEAPSYFRPKLMKAIEQGVAEGFKKVKQRGGKL